MLGFLKRRPFNKNKTRDEYVRWFSTAKYWKKLDIIIINGIIDKFIDDPLAFEDFVRISEDCNLVENNYPNFGEDVGFALPMFALTLYNTWVLYRDALINELDDDCQNIKVLSELEKYSQSALESAIKLNEYFFVADYQIAFIKGNLLKKYNQGIERCKIGLERIRKLKSMKIDELNNYQRASLKETEKSQKMFDALIQEFEQIKTLKSKKNESKTINKKIIQPEFMHLILDCLFSLFSGKISNSDKIAFANWAGLPKNAWDKSHWNMFSIAMLHYFFEKGNEATKWIEARIITIVMTACVIQVLSQFKEGQLSEKVRNALGYFDEKDVYDITRFQKALSGFQDIDINKIDKAAQDNAILKEVLQKAYSYGGYILREKLPPLSEIKNIPSIPIPLTDDIRHILYNLVLKLDGSEKRAT